MKEGMEEGLIRPVRGKLDPKSGPDVLMVMIASELKDFVATTRAREQGRSGTLFFQIHQFEDAGRLQTLAGPFLGSPHAVMGLEKLIVLGAQRVWIFGYCGSLQPDLKIGDLVVPTRALSEEGTSSHYPVGTEPEADPGLVGILEKTLKDRGRPGRLGPIWTTDAPYRETPEKVRTYGRRGILAVDMEMSALMTVAAYRGIRASGLLVVSDELSGMRWHSGFSDPRLKESALFAREALIDAVKVACRTDKG